MLFKTDVEAGEAAAVWPRNPQGMRVKIELRAHEESPAALPPRISAPRVLPEWAPRPMLGEVIYLTSTSAWAVRLVTHDWMTHDALHVVCWLVYVGPTHHAPRCGLPSTQ